MQRKNSAPRRRRAATWHDTLRRLYEGNSAEAHAFRYALLVFDVVTIAFLIVTSFFEHTLAIEVTDALIGLVILADLAARLWIAPRPWRELAHPYGIADLIVIFSFLAPIVGEGFAFLRVLRTLRLLRSYRLVARLKRDFPFFRQHEAVVLAIIHLIVFLFVMTALVYETQHRTNPQIANYADALYFTVTALTTTGFGDITLPGTSGRLLSVLIMIFGVSLFVRLIQVLFRPAKVEFECPSCGLMRHDYDAVHCKACGVVLHIRDEGA
jgi:voltage-gated potassium channel